VPKAAAKKMASYLLEVCMDSFCFCYYIIKGSTQLLTIYFKQEGEMEISEYIEPTGSTSSPQTTQKIEHAYRQN
jgi:hypothetical protein